MEARTTVISACLLTLLVLGCSLAQEQEQSLANKAKEQLDALNASGDLNKTVEQGQAIFRKKCQENAKEGGEEAYNKTQEAREVLEMCIKKNVNMTEVQQQMEAARPDGRLDEVFKTYCDRKTILQKCLHDFTDTLVPCLKENERKNLKVVHNITEQLASFICHKDGDRIALFIAEKGPECLTEKTDAIHECVSKYTDVKDSKMTSNMTIEDVAMFNLEFSSETCGNMEKLQKCVVDALQTCSQPTPSNIADALFKYVIKATPCSNIATSTSKQTGGPNSAAYASAGVATLASALAAILLF